MFYTPPSVIGFQFVPSGCYELVSELPPPETNIAIVDSGPIDTFAPNNISLSRSIELTISTGSPDRGQAVTNWAVAITTAGDITISAVGTITWHDCPSAGAQIYRVNDACDNVSLVTSISFHVGACDTLIPYDFNYNGTVTLSEGSYIIVFIIGPLTVTNFSSPSRADGFCTANISITGTNFVPLPLSNSPISCNRLLLPPLTESTNNWYASLSAAQTALTSVRNCLAYFDNQTAEDTFTATNPAGSLVLTTSKSTLHSAIGDWWFSLSASMGDTITLAASTDGVTYFTTFLVYDYDGNLLTSYSQIFSAPPFTTPALPYTGKYIIKYTLRANPPSSRFRNTTATITSSGTLVVNPVQALWDTGLDCPARLDCV